MDLSRYPLELIKSRLSVDKKYMGVMVPLSLYEKAEIFAYENKLTLSDIIRLVLWDFLMENKEDVEDSFKQN